MRPRQITLPIPPVVMSQSTYFYRLKNYDMLSVSAGFCLFAKVDYKPVWMSLAAAVVIVLLSIVFIPPADLLLPPLPASTDLPIPLSTPPPTHNPLCIATLLDYS